MDKQKLKRFEVNKIVRRALVKANVDLEKCQYSYVGRTLTFTGTLLKVGNRDLTATELDAILTEIGSMGLHLASELTNWTITGTSVSKKQDEKIKKNEDALHGKASKDEMGGS